MHYLTNHDLVWINTVVTGHSMPYNYVTLESCMAAQYAYKDSSHPEAQAAAFLARLRETAPFAGGNRRTAFLALLTFLELNGLAVRKDPLAASQAMLALHQGTAGPQQTVEALLDRQSPAPAPAVLRALVTHLTHCFADALSALSAGD